VPVHSDSAENEMNSVAAPPAGTVIEAVAVGSST
jgi:hypothetical protein